MKILFDENMPYAQSFFSEFGECQSFVGRELTAEQMKDADVLLVRSITKVNEALLSQNDSLKFVGTATIGVDHIDQDLLKNKAVSFSSAPGCNAKSVADYVISSLFVIAERHQWQLQGKTIGIIGVGNIGSTLSVMAEALGMTCLLCDPILAKTDDNRDFVSLDQAMQADIVTLHVPITNTGEYKTKHLIDEDRLADMQDGQVLINSCRGAVVDNHALLNTMKSGKKLHLVMDVWENEPDISLQLMEFCEIATAHIAGYSTEGKGRGTEMLYQRLCAIEGKTPTLSLDQFLPKYAISDISLQGEIAEADYKTIVHAIYDVRRDDALLRNNINESGKFDWLRKNYPTRREMSSVKISAGNMAQKEALYALGFRT